MTSTFARITRRAALRHVAAAVGGVATGSTLTADVDGRAAAAEPETPEAPSVGVSPTTWFSDEATGRFWPVDDVSRWIDRSIHEEVLRRARDGLVKHADPERRLRLVLRRCGVVYVEVLPPQAAPGIASAATVRVHHWRQDRGDLRPIFTSLGLARPEIAVQFVNRKHDTVSWSCGDEFRYGRPFPDGPALDGLIDRWRRRQVPAPADWMAATKTDWLPRWPQLGGDPGIPWAALEAAWQIVTPRECPNCHSPTILAGFGSRRVSCFRFDPRQEHACPGCRRIHVVPLDELDVRVAAVLRRGAARPAPWPGGSAS